MKNFKTTAAPGLFDVKYRKVVAGSSPMKLFSILSLAVLLAAPLEGVAQDQSNIQIAKIEGRFWLVGPDGRPFFAHGVTHLSNPAHGLDVAKIGQACKEFGFNAYGYGCPRPLKKDLPYLEGRNLVPISTYRNDGSFRFVDIFDPEEQRQLAAQIERLCNENRDNPNLIGYCWTDLGAWPLKNAIGRNWVDFIRGLPDESPGQNAWRGFLKTWTGDDPDARDLGFLRTIAREYFRVVGEANRKHDPNHLIFGDRFSFNTIVPEVLEEMLPWVDAIAIQPPFQPGFPRKKFDEIHRLTGKPILICDFAIRFQDGDKQVGGRLEESAQAAGERYAEYLREAMETPYLIGAFWCNPIDSKDRFNNTGIKQGIFDLGLVPRPGLNQAIRELNRFIEQRTPLLSFAFHPNAVAGCATGMEQFSLADNIDGVLNGLPAPGMVCGTDVIARLRPSDRTAGVLKTTPVSVADMRFAKALEIQVADTAKYVHWVQLGVSNTEAVQKGDILFLSFWMQSVWSENETGEGLVSVAFQKAWDDRAFERGFAVECDGVWRRQYVRAVARRDYQAGEATLRFQLGFRPQKIRIADVRLLNFADRVEFPDLPAMPLSYKGMEPGAAWRQEAWERIERHRKSDVTLKVTDANGNPVSDAQVSLEQTRLAFGLGAAHSAMLYHADSFREDLPAFQQNFDRLFNKAVLPNILKWKQYPRRGKAAILPAYQWLSENEIPVRGHCIIWPGWNYLPAELRRHEDNPDTLRRLCEERIDSLMADWSGQLAEWDVVNEVYMQDDLLQICGREVLVDWFKQARRLDPGAKLYYNDANTLANHQPGHADHYYETIKWLLEQGAPVDGMGFQSHIHTLVSPATVYRRIDRFGELGPDIQITEFDIQVPEIAEDLQAQYARDYLLAVFSHPKTVGVITWLGGMPLREMPTAHRDARAQCAFFREDWSIKPIGQMWLDLVEKEWKTNASGSTDEDGKFCTRGFHGRYKVSVTKGRAHKTTETQLGEQSETIRLVID